jgi:hypothetical protein
MIERIDMNKHLKPGALQKTLVFSALSGFFFLAQAATVAPPPLPAGSSMVQQHVGLNPEEVKRSQRAHHHNGHYKKNYNRDDTLDAPQAESNMRDTKNGSGNQSALPKTR